MPNPTWSQTSFTSGELSPRLLARSDLARYGNGVATLENMLIQKHGPVQRRPGTSFVADTKDTQTSRLIPFRFSVDEQYVLELGDQYVRVYRDRIQLQEASTPIELAMPYLAGQVNTVKYTQSADILYLCHPNHAPREIRRTGPDNLQASWSTLVRQNRDGPFLQENTLPSGEFYQGNNPTNTITAYETNGGPGTPFSTGDTVDLVSTVPSGDPTFVTGDGRDPTNPATPEDLITPGRVIRLFDTVGNNNWIWFEILSVTDAQNATAEVIRSGLSNVASFAAERWRLGAWTQAVVSTTNIGPNWPSVVEFHQNRLWYANTRLQPQTVWSTNTATLFNFGPTDISGGGDSVIATNSVVRTIDDDEVNTIQWLDSDSQGMMIATDSGLFLGRSQDGPFGAITPDDFAIQRQNRDTAHPNVRPQQANSFMLLVGSSGRRIREQQFDIQPNRIRGVDLTVTSEHITEGGIQDSCYQREPDSTLWFPRSDGQLLALTYERDEEVVGWQRHIVGGSQAKVISCEVARQGDEDVLYVIVNRDDAEKNTVEALNKHFEQGDAHDRYVGMDGALSYPAINGMTTTTSTPVTDTEDQTLTVTYEGLGHLEGEIVQVAADGATIPAPIVTDGEGNVLSEDFIVLGGEVVVVYPLAEYPTEPDQVHIGAPYVGRVVSMPLIPTAGFDVRGRMLKTVHMMLNVWRSLDGQVGDADLQRFADIFDRTASMSVGQVADLFTGMRVKGIEGAQTTLPKTEVKLVYPQPFTLLGMTAEVTVGDISSA